MQSGVVASKEIINDLYSALPEGLTQARDILEKRVFSKQESMKATIHRNKRLNLPSKQICEPSGIYINATQMEKYGLAALMDFAENRGMISLEMLLERRVTEECLSMYNVDGSMRKTAKSKLLQSFSRNAVTEKPYEYASLVDIGLIWRLSTPTSEDREAKKRNGSEYLWGDYLEKICSMIISRHSGACRIILVNDKYTGFSIKDDEHDRRAAKHVNIPDIYPKKDDMFPGPAQFNKLMLGSENKVRLQKLVKQQMMDQVDQVLGGVIYCEADVTTNLTTGMENDDSGIIIKMPGIKTDPGK